MFLVALNALKRISTKST